jgi:hypothetical protein
MLTHCAMASAQQSSAALTKPGALHSPLDLHRFDQPLRLKTIDSICRHLFLNAALSHNRPLEVPTLVEVRKYELLVIVQIHS